MAKKELKNLATRKKEAKTFHDLVAVLVADHKGVIRHMQRLLKARRRPTKANRLSHEKTIRWYESKLRLLESRRQRYERYQGNKKIPAALRKRIAELETEILRRESSYDPFWRSFVRYRKKDLAELFEQVEHLCHPPKPLSTTNKLFKVGKDYLGQSITRAYDGHVWEVLKGHFERLPRTKGQRASFKIVAALPEKPEYLQLKERHYMQTLETVVEDAYGIVDELQEELQEAYDNMPDGLQGGPVGEARAEAAAQLEEISGNQPDLPESVLSLCIVHYPSLRQSSRRDRAREAAAMMLAANQAIQQYRKSAKLGKGEAKALDEFGEQLEAHADEIDGVEFPGMFG